MLNRHYSYATLTKTYLARTDSSLRLFPFVISFSESDGAMGCLIFVGPFLSHRSCVFFDIRALRPLEEISFPIIMVMVSYRGEVKSNVLGRSAVGTIEIE